MQEDARLRFQGKCLVSVEGCETMKHFDVLPFHIRKRLRESPFNLCCMCACNIRRIEEMEEMIRAGN